MSRVGKLPIELPEKIEFKFQDNVAKVTGPKGTLELTVPRVLDVVLKDRKLEVVAKNQDKKTKALHGTIRVLLANMIKGVDVGWKKQLELVGTGYRAQLEDKELVLTVGFSHPVRIKAPEGISFTVEKTLITIEGIDKQLVGQIAAKIRAVRPPEPYKGKGIKYVDEEVRRKPGKVAKTGGA
jgi:large subunit ribosomal protein L6